MERSAPVDKPVVMFTVGTIPNSRHALCELCPTYTVCELFHRCWDNCFTEECSPLQEESEEETRSEESESQTGQENDAAESDVFLVA